MNEHFVPLRTLEAPIDLGRERDFVLGPLEVTPSTCEVRAGAETWRLEPRVMQVLVALWRAESRVVSRNELVSSCWNDRVVGDDALNRCIARLRRLFEAAGAPIAIVTISRIGYRLEVDAPLVETPVAEIAVPRRRRNALWLTAALVGTTAATGLAWQALHQPAGWTAEGFRPFAAETLIERHPAFSPDGRSLAYALGPDTDSRRIAVRGLDGGPVVQVSEGPGDEYAPAWDPNGSRLAFARYQPGKPCEIVVRTLPAGSVDVVGHCEKAARTRLAWSKSGDTLFFTDGAWDSTRIRALDLATGHVQDLTRPDPRAGESDIEPMISPDGRRLAFLRSQPAGRVRIMTVELAGGRLAEVESPGLTAGGLAWTPDSRWLVAASDHGDFSLWLLNADGRAPPRRLLTGLRAIGRVAISAQGRAAIEMDSARINLVRLGGQEISPANSSDWSPDFAPDGSLAFISNRGGGKAVWVMRPGQGAYQIPGSELDHVYGVRWSPDGRRLAFAGSKAGVAGLYLAGRDGPGLLRLGAAALDFGAPTWSQDGRSLIAPAKDGSGWRLVRAALDEHKGAQPISDYGWMSVRSGPEGLFAVRTDRPGIWRLGAAAPTLVVADFNASMPEDWSLAGGKLYVLRRARAPRGDADVWAYPAGGGEGERVGHASRIAEEPGLAVDPTSGSPVFPKILFEDSDIGLLTLKPGQ